MHTKEPWAYRPDVNDDWGIIRAPVTKQGQWLGGIICQARDPERIGESELAACRVARTDPWESNARRIVACVNACAGMSDPAAEIAKLRKDLAEAVGALAFARQIIREIDEYMKRPDRGDWGVECACCMGELLDDDRETIATIDATLAKIKGE